jgi:hypothetical protein
MPAIGESIGGEDVKPYIKQSVNGFQLVGADKTGKCVLLESEEAVPKTQYLDDPTITFEDGILTGCYIDLTLKELQEFCTQENFKRIVLFNNLQNLKYMGKYGNSDPHLQDEWVRVEAIPANKDFKFNDNRCNIPTYSQINVFYNRIGKDSDPQRTIVTAQVEEGKTS